LDNDKKATQLLTQHKRELKNAVRSVMLAFNDGIEIDEVRQEAQILLMSYAGLIPGRHFGSLASIATETNPSGLLTYRLRLDLCELFGRQLKKLQPTYSLTEVLEKNADPVDEYLEDRIIDEVDAERDIYQRYPYITMAYLEDLSHLDIAQIMDVSERTVRNRLADERYRFASAAIDKREALKAA